MSDVMLDDISNVMSDVKLDDMSYVMPDVMPDVMSDVISDVMSDALRYIMIMSHRITYLMFNGIVLNY
jgi:hypothetical protein